MKLYLRGKYYYFKPCINGKQKWVNTHQDSKLKARLFAEDYIVQQRKDTTAKTGNTNIDLSWKAFCDLYMQYCRQAKKTQNRDKDTIKLIDKFLGIKYFKELTTQRIRDLIDIRLKNGIKKSSINRELICIKSMWTFAKKELKFPMEHQAQPIKKYKLPIITKTRVLSAEEIKKCLNIANKTDLTILYLLLYIGLRLKDAVLLKWHNVHFDEHCVNFTPNKTDRIEPNEDYTPMTTKLEKYLSDLKKETNADENDYVVPNLKERNSKSSLSHRIKDIFVSLGIEGVTAHTCRHTFITSCFEAGIDTADIMKWARIKDLKTLMVYKHQTRKTDLKNINKIPY
jgi:site-specific recombinase XerD